MDRRVLIFFFCFIITGILFFRCASNSEPPDDIEVEEDVNIDLNDIEVNDEGMRFCENVEYELEPVPITARETQRLVVVISNIGIVESSDDYGCDIDGDGYIERGGFSSLRDKEMLSGILRGNITDGNMIQLMEFLEVTDPAIPQSQGGSICMYEGDDTDSDDTNNLSGGARLIISPEFLEMNNGKGNCGQIRYLNKFFEAVEEKVSITTYMKSFPSGGEEIPVELKIYNVKMKGCASPYFTMIKKTVLCGYIDAKDLAEAPSPLPFYENFLALLVESSVDYPLIDVDVNRDGGLDRIYLRSDKSLSYRCYDSENMSYYECSKDELKDGVSIVFELEGVWVNLVEGSAQGGGI